MTDRTDPTGPPPRDNDWATATWLMRRHPKLRALVERVICIDADGDLDLLELGDAVRAFDAYVTAWREYMERHPEPRDDGPQGTRYTEWEAAGPQHVSPRSAALGPMSSSERKRLRLLAFWAGGVVISPDTFVGMDVGGMDLIVDWCRAVAPDPAVLARARETEAMFARHAEATFARRTQGT